MNVRHALLLVGVSGLAACSIKHTAGGAVATAEAVITPAGGELVLGDASLRVPPGAVAAPVTIRVEQRSPALGSPPRDVILGAIFDFFPEGLTFNPPAVLTLGNPHQVTAATIAWWSAPRGEWVAVPSLNADDYLSVSAEIQHFSSWGLHRPDVPVPIECGATSGCNDALNYACVGGFCECMPGLSECRYFDAEGPSGNLCVNLQNGTTRVGNSTLSGTDCGYCGNYCPKAAFDLGLVDSECIKGRCTTCTPEDTRQCPTPCDRCVDGQCQPGCTGCTTCFQGQCLPQCPSCQTCDQTGATPVCVATECGPCERCFADSCVSDCLATETCQNGLCVGSLCQAGETPCGQRCCTSAQTCINGGCCDPCPAGWIACPVPIEGNTELLCGYACCNPAEPVCCPGSTPWAPRCCKVCGGPGSCAG